jgi:oxygen-independent coproporphyrinogen-3 oxidase
VLAGAGYAHYEVSNYAIPGGESEHNSAYWRRSSYVGLGPSAHSFGCGVRRWNEREYVAWLRRASRGEDPVGGAEDLSPDAIALEEVYLGLRTTAGVQVGATDRPVIEPWVRSGWAMEEQGVLTLTPLGWLRLDALAGALTEFRSRL